MTGNTKKKDYKARMKHLLIILVSFGLIFFSLSAFSQNDSQRKEPPPHPKHKSIKEIWNKINPFKKKKKDPSGDQDEAVKPPEPEPEPTPPPKPAPGTTPAKRGTATKKKTKKIINPKTNKPTKPLI